MLILQTENGKTKACYGGYSYYYEKDSKFDLSLTFWQCEEYWLENKYGRECMCSYQ